MWKRYNIFVVLGGLHDRRTDHAERQLGHTKARNDDEALRKSFAMMRQRGLTGFTRVVMADAQE